MAELNSAREPRSLFRLLVGLAAVIVILAGMQAISGLLNLVLLAFLITLLTLPVMHRLQARGMSSRLAYLVVLGMILAVTLVIAVMALISLANAAGSAQLDLENFQAQTTTLAGASTTLAQLKPPVDQAARTVLDVVTGVVANSIGFIVGGVFVLLITAFMLAEAETFGALVRRTVGADNPTYQRVSASTSSVITYITITAIINLVIAIGDVILLAVLGVPNPLLWGLVSFVFGFIPYIGYWISFLPPFVLAFGVGGPTTAFLVLIGYALINGVVSQIVAPRMYGKGLNMSITLTIVAVLFWGGLLGPVGGMLAVPMTAIIKSALLASYPETAWLATILGNSREEVKAQE